MSKIILLVFLVVAGTAVSLLTACTVIRGSGNLITESRSVSDFDRLDLSGSGKLILTQGETERLTVETDDNVMEHIMTEVRSGTLHLGTDVRQGVVVDPTKLIFTLQVTNLNGLNVSGSGSVEAETMQTSSLDIDISGSGTAQIDTLTADRLRVDISGSSDVEIAGEVADARIDISGSGNIDAGNLRSETVDITISGSGTATAWATETLDVDLSGSSTVNYYGEPTVNSSTSGSGTVNSLGGK